MGRRPCEEEGCSKEAIAGGTGFCIAHGGGERCQEESCAKGCARRRTAPSPLKATRGTAACMGAADAASTRAASRVHKATRGIARRTEGAGAKRSAASNPLQATRGIARRTGAAGAARRWAAPSPL
jgi:hypothetical protein